MPFAILWPTFALVALIWTVWFWLFIARIGHLRRVPPRADEFATGASVKAYFEPVEMPANNLTNLFEMPVLFFALVPLLLFTHHANHIQAALAWIFVILRVVHGYAHFVAKNVKLRAIIYWLSCAALLAMWIGFFVDMVAAASAYHAAMANLAG